MFWKMFSLLMIGLSVCFHMGLDAALEANKKVKYPFVAERVDVVIPATVDDLESLNLCIDGIKENCNELGRIIVVSSKRLSDKAEWVDEKAFPFSKYEVAYYLNEKDAEAAAEYLRKSPVELQGYYQQLIEAYAPFVIPNISSNVLVLDPDIIFLKPVSFLNSDSAGLYAPTTGYQQSHFIHAEALVPGFKRFFFTYSAMTHHIVLQKCVLNDLFGVVEKQHGMPFWKAFCKCVAKEDLISNGASLHEIYFNFVFSKTNQVKIKRLKGFKVMSLTAIEPLKQFGYHYVICPTVSRKWLVDMIQKNLSEAEAAKSPTGTTTIIVPQMQYVETIQNSKVDESKE